MALAALGFASLGLPEGALGVAWPSIRASFDLPLDALGLLLATFASGYFVASAASGRMLARFGIGSVLAGCCTLTGTCLLGYALAPSWPAMLVLGCLLGAGGGVIDAALNTYAALRHGARALNLMHAAYGLGAAIAPLIMTAVLAQGLRWNVGYAAVAGLQLALAGGYLATRQQFSQTRSAGSAPPAAMAAAGPGPASAATHQPRALLSRPLAWISLATFFVYVGVEVAVGQWSFSLFTQSRGVPPAVAGLAISGYWTGLTAGRALFGLVISRLSVDWLLRACMLAMLLATVVLWFDPIPLASLLAPAVIGLAEAPIFPSLIAITPARLGPRHAADAIGLQVAAAVLGGASLPGAIGVAAARAGLETIGPCLVGMACALLALHEALVRRAFEPPQNARCQNSAAANARPGA